MKSLLDGFADELDKEPETTPAGAPQRARGSSESLPDVVDEIGPKSFKADGYFWLDTGFGFELGWSDGRRRTARSLPREAIELFGPLDNPNELPRWLFHHELDRPVPIWHFSEGDRVRIGLPADWHKARAVIDGVDCCFRCGRSLYWVDVDGVERCIVCLPPKFRDERSTLVGWRRLPGHVWGCDQW